jgi:hypothetical protein
MAQPAARRAPADSLPAAEFSRLVRDLSEEGGYFFSDNFTSNEDSYLTVLDKMRELGARGGAYIGVGPEQNFTYIAKIRPRIAFIVDIRRQAVIQHLMYKAIFTLAPTREQFLARLLSRPLANEKALPPDATIDDVLRAFGGVAADPKTYAENLATLEKTIEKDFQFALSAGDRASLEYVYRSFRDKGLTIGFELDGWSRMRFGRLPDLRDLLTQKDLNGKQENFLAHSEDYEFVRDLHRRNLIVPVVGDFAGKKALAGIGDYLRKRNQTVTAFYLSNVEMVLFSGGGFPAFVENVRRLPITDRTLLVRAAFWFYGHPAQPAGYRVITLLQRASVFLKDFDQGLYPDYRDLLVTHYIAAEQPRK